VTAVWRLLSPIISLAALLLAPLAIVLGVHAAFLNGQIGSAYESLIVNSFETDDTFRAEALDDLAESWLEQHGDQSAIDKRTLIAAFDSVVETDEFEAMIRSSGRQISEAWERGEGVDFSVDLTDVLPRLDDPDLIDPLLPLSDGTLEALRANPVVEVDRIENIHADKLDTVALVGIGGGGVLLALTYLVTRSGKRIGWIFGWVAGWTLLIILLVRTVIGRSVDVGTSSLAGWLTERLWLPWLVMTGLGVGSWVLAYRSNRTDNRRERQHERMQGQMFNPDDHLPSPGQTVS